MPGFKHCSWCGGKGCMCCDGERAKWEKHEAERLDREAALDPCVKLHRLEESRDFLAKSHVIDMSAEDRAHIMAKIDGEIAEAQAACDAEYKRLFPDGPKPILSVRPLDPHDMDLLRHVAGREVLEKAFGPDGEGVVEIELRAAEARNIQAAIRHGE